jgi:2-C-methyl-D-erythritol 4-phosphate cytidylyltransferase
MKLYAVIVAGGIGTRMGTDIPKQFLELAGKPVLMHTIERFLTFSNSIHIITVLPGEYLEFWDQLKRNIPLLCLISLSEEVKHGSYQSGMAWNMLMMMPLLQSTTQSGHW